MKKTGLLLALAIPALLYFSCTKSINPPSGGGGTVYLDLPAVTHAYNSFTGDSILNEKITLGRVLFYDQHLSVNNTVACGSCHKQAYAFADNATQSRGFENKLTARNAPALQNLGFSGFTFNNSIGSSSGGGDLFWDGRETSLLHLIARPVTNHIEMGIEDVNSLPGKLANLPYYGSLFQKAFGTSNITTDEISEAVADFVAALQSVNTRFDQYQQRTGTLSALELEGQSLFTQKYNCASCHNEQINGYFSGNFMDIGLDYAPTDKGIGAISGNTSDNGKFKVPNLRNVALTAPYMHDGRFKTLDEVLEHYSHGIQNDPNLSSLLRNASGQPMQMNISAQEKTAIIAFLNTLTDADMTTDPYLANPFKTK